MINSDKRLSAKEAGGLETEQCKILVGGGQVGRAL